MDPHPDHEPTVLDRLNARARKGCVPIRVKIDLTYACNLRCVHCCIVRQDRPELRLDEIRTLLDALKRKGSLFLSLSGGEIFLREDLEEILRAARERGFCLTLMTNATRIPARLLPGLRDLGVAEVATSLYGDSPRVHDAVTRTPGSFVRAVDAIRRLRAEGIRVKASLMLLRENAARYSSMVELAESLDAAWNLDASVFPRFDGSLEPLTHRVTGEELRRAVDFREKRTGDLKRMRAAWDKERWLQQAPCGAGRMACAVTPYGDLLPCSVMPLNAGNLRDTPFDRLWEESGIFRRLRSLQRSDLTECASCYLAPFCGLCPGRALAENGDLLGPCRARCLEAAVHREVYLATYGEDEACLGPEP